MTNCSASKKDLSSIAKEYLGGISVPVNLPNLEFVDLEISVIPGTEDFSLKGKSNSTWNISLGASSNLAINDLALDLSRTTKESGKAEVNGEITGKLAIGNINFKVVCKFPGDVVLILEVPSIKLSDITSQILTNMAVPAELADFNAEASMSVTPATGDFVLNANIDSLWKISLGEKGIEISKLGLEASCKTSDNGKKEYSGKLSGTMIIGSTSVLAQCVLSSDDLVISGEIESIGLSRLIQDLCGAEAIRSMPIPPGIQDIVLSDIALAVSPKKKFFCASCSTCIGQAELIVKQTDCKWGFAAGFMPPATWMFSQIDSKLKVLDDLNFANTAIVLSSSDDSSLSMKTVKVPQSINIIKGLNFFANMDMTSIGIDKVLGLKTIAVSAAVSKSLADMKIAADVGGQFCLAENVTFNGIKFSLKPSPDDFSVALEGSVTTVLNNSELKFIGSMSVGINEATLSATMLGDWRDPFDARGVVISKLGLELGIAYATGLPTIGLAGNIGIDKYTGSAAILFDAGTFSKSMISASIDGGIYVMDILRACCDPEMQRVISADVANTVLNIGLECAKVYIVPQATNIGELKYDAGFSVEGAMKLMGIRGYAYLDIDYAKGIEIRGDVDEINLGDVFRFGGACGREKAALNLVAKPLQNPVPLLFLTGEVRLLGISRDTEIQFSKDGFYFLTGGKIFDQFEASMEVRTNALANLNGFFVKATMQNDLTNFLRDNAQIFIDRVVKDASGGLDNAINGLNEAQDEVNSLLGKIEKTKQAIQQEKNVAQANLRAGQNSLASAQAEVDRLQAEINKSKDLINMHKQAITNKWNWANAGNIFEKVGRGIAATAEATWRGTAITGLYSYIGGVETAKLTAIGALEVAKQTVRAIEASAAFLPIESDPRMIGLYTAYGTATGGLQTAKLAVETAKMAMGPLGDVAKFINDFGLGGLINITKASFEGNLNAVSGGAVSMSMDVSFMKTPSQRLQIDFDFRDPLKAAESLAQMLVRH